LCRLQQANQVFGLLVVPSQLQQVAIQKVGPAVLAVELVRLVLLLLMLVQYALLQPLVLAVPAVLPQQATKVHAQVGAALATSALVGN
jgi:hypothetical protein